MAYTEFRKSYGDFEIVIPAIDFSELNGDEAEKTIEVFRNYEDDYVCFNLSFLNKGNKAERRAVEKIISEPRGVSQLIFKSFTYPAPFDEGIFKQYSQARKVLRKAWCNHMANEIECEHFGHANQTT